MQTQTLPAGFPMSIEDSPLSENCTLKHWYRMQLEDQREVELGGGTFAWEIGQKTNWMLPKFGLFLVSFISYRWKPQSTIAHSTFIARPAYIRSRVGILGVRVSENLLISSSTLPGLGRVSGTTTANSRTFTLPFPSLIRRQNKKFVGIGVW